MRTILVTATSLALVCGATGASALVHVDIDLTHQSMHVDADEGTYDWPISTARSGFYTPGGSFAPTHLELMHYSKKYHMSPMPHAIFFRGGYAIHGTYSTASLGRPASHGCVRLSPGNAADLYGMVQREGARISIHGTPPASQPFYTAGRHTHRSRYAGAYADGSSRYAPGFYGYSAVPYGTATAYPGYDYSYAPSYGEAPPDPYYGY